MKLIFLLFGLIAVQALPHLHKDFFWFQTDDGHILPAFLTPRGTPKAKGPVEEEVFFYHYLPGSDEGSQLTLNCTNCFSSFIPGAPVIFGAHGFGSGGHNGNFGTNIRLAFANYTEPINIILINWDNLSKNPDYLGAVNNMKDVGEYTAKLINFLVSEGLSSLDTIYYAGHSLGAHIPNWITLDNDGKIKAVFDPAGPLLDIRDASGRLDQSDAQFVNAMHTSVIFLGYRNPLGHVDFYPNSGKGQPGCDDNIFGHCSHAICHEFFKESVTNPNSFQSCNCKSWEEFQDGSCPCEEKVPMGFHTPITARGNFYLRTNPEPPYGL